MARKAAASAGPSRQVYLLLDAGNSRLKWAVLQGAGLEAAALRAPQPFSARGVLTAAEASRPGALSVVLRKAGRDAAVHVCNVAGPALEGAIRAAAARVGVARPRFVRSVAAGSGITNGYAEPWRLGVDRWAALIGAHQRYPARDLCIVGVGSAMTIDLLTASGRHRGGCIVPGPYLMIDTLLQRTAGIRRRAGASSADVLARAASRSAPRSGRTPFARDTRSALLSGCTHACAWLIDGMVEAAHRRGSLPPDLIITGGGAPSIAPLLRTPHRCDEDLVLRGLAGMALERRSARRRA